MKEPNWVSLEDCLTFHEKLLAKFGGLDGLRDKGLLESALNRPLQLFHYGNPTTLTLAAAYAEGIVKNHPFLDGNKRSGFMAAALFLESNGYCITVTEEEAVVMTVALAAGDVQAEGYARWLGDNTRPKE